MLCFTVMYICKWSPFLTWCGSTSATTSLWPTTRSQSSHLPSSSCAIYTPSSVCVERGRRRVPTDQVITPYFFFFFYISNILEWAFQPSELCIRGNSISTNLLHCASFQSCFSLRKTKRSFMILRSSVLRHTSMKRMISFTRGVRSAYVLPQKGGTVLSPLKSYPKLQGFLRLNPKVDFCSVRGDLLGNLIIGF